MRDVSAIACWLVIGAALGSVQASPGPAPDCSARYDVNQTGVDPPAFATIPSKVVVDGAAVDLEGWCRLEGVRRKAMPNGGVRLRRRFRACGAMRAGLFEATLNGDCAALRAKVKLKKGHKRLFFYALRHQPPSTFHTIEDRIFSGRGCAVSTCHGSTHEGNLDLRPGAAFASLVGVDADNAAAGAAGKVRVAPGDAAASFLSAKLHGTLAPEEGSAMPLTGDPLLPIEIALIDAWIAAGAPETGEVEGAPELPPLEYVETPPLPPPADGFQLVLEGPVLQPGQEQEGCLWVTAPTPVDVPIQKIEMALNPGTHHFVIWRHTGPVAPPLDTWLANDIACLNSGGNFGQSIAGAPHAPYFLAEQPPGFASLLPGGTYYGLNAHYYNESSKPIQMKVWVNLYPYAGTPEHLVQTLPLALDASNKINVPPNTQTTVRGRLVNISDKVMHLMGLGGHMHKRGVRFSIWTSDGAKVIDDFDWAHPSFAAFDPPRPLVPGDWVDFECLHDNGVTRPLRRDGAGNPMTIVFGTSAEDEMCIITGQFYDD